MRVLKFGGTSVATPERRQRVAEIVATAWKSSVPVTVVTSALAGVTDLLVEAIDQARTQRCMPVATLETLSARFRAQRLAEGHPAGDDVPIDGEAALWEALERALLGIALLGECPTAVRHEVLATGERLTLPWVAAALRRGGVPVRVVDGAELIVTAAADSGPEPAIDLPATTQRVASHRSVSDASVVTLVPGFLGADSKGRTTTLGRGASDLTATVLGEALGASVVEIWSDVDGVLEASPAWVPGAGPLPRLTYGAAADLARFGARVLHPCTLVPAARGGIPVWIRNTLHPEASGTWIDATGNQGSAEGARVAVTALGDCAMLEVSEGATPGLGFVASAEAAGVRPLLWAGGLRPETLRPVLRGDDADRLERCLCTAGVTWRRRDGLAVVAVVQDGSTSGGTDGREARASPLRKASQVLQALDEAAIVPLALTLPEAETLGDGPTTTLATSKTIAAATTVAVLVEASQARGAVEALHRCLVGSAAEGVPAQGEVTGSPLALRSAQIKQEPAIRAL